MEMDMSPSPVSTRGLRLISTALLAVAATTVALRPKPVRADEQGSFRGTLTVQFTAATTHAQCASTDCNNCIQISGLYIEAQGLADTSLGPLFAKVLKCLNPAKGKYGSYAGTMTLSVTPPVTPPSLIPPPKDILTLTYSGQNDDGGDFYGFQPFSGSLTPVKNGSSGKFQGAQGAITFIAQSGPALATSGAANISYSGNAFYSLHGTIGQGEQ
jgi:hypothetical protein